MAVHVHATGDWKPDDGSLERHYPIPEIPSPLETSDLVYDKYIQDINANHAAMVAVFNDWITSFFPPNYFKFVRIKTQSSFADFKSFMKQIYKKDKPFMVIDPKEPVYATDSVYAQNMLNRYNIMDPRYEYIGAKMMYSIEILHTDLIQLYCRRNRLRMEFDIMIMEQTRGRQANTYNALMMNIRHNSMFGLVRIVPFLIPNRYIYNIAVLHGYTGDGWKSDEFLHFLNVNSAFPIIRRVTANGKYMFFFEKEAHIHVETPSMPERDSPEMSDAIEWGARVVDQFVFEVDLPAEYLFLIRKEYVTKFDRGFDDPPEAITFTSPIYADRTDWPAEIGDYKLTNRIDVQIEEEPTAELPLLPYIKDAAPTLYEEIREWINRGFPIGELVAVRVYPNGSIIDTGYILEQSGLLRLTSVEPNKLYTINVYIDRGRINTIRSGRNAEYIGTIEKY